MPLEFSVGAIVVHGDNYLLLKYGAGHWGFVKGNVEKGETAEETARREIKEETGISIVVFVKGFKEKEEYFYRKEGEIIHKEVVYLLGETPETNVTLSKEHTAFAWLPYEQAMNTLTHRQSKEILKKVQDYLKNH